MSSSAALTVRVLSYPDMHARWRYCPPQTDYTYTYPKQWSTVYTGCGTGVAVCEDTSTPESRVRSRDTGWSWIVTNILPRFLPNRTVMLTCVSLRSTTSPPQRRKTEVESCNAVGGCECNHASKYGAVVACTRITLEDSCVHFSARVCARRRCRASRRALAQ